MLLQSATISDCSVLTTITLLSKNYWNYGSEQMKKWEKELTITADYVRSNQVTHLTVDHQIIGYYSYFPAKDGILLLDNLFILPEHINKGYGKVLMDHFLESARKEKATWIHLYSDPHAEGFYRKYGFKVLEKIPTSIPGRDLPKMGKSLTAKFSPI